MFVDTFTEWVEAFSSPVEKAMEVSESPFYFYLFFIFNINLFILIGG